MTPALRAVLFGPPNPLRAAIRTLFGNGEKGFFGLASPDYIRQTELAAGSVALGGTLGFWQDLSPNANHAKQGTASLRPKLQRDDDGYYYLEGDAANDFLATAATDFTGTDKITVWAAVHKASDAARGILVELTNDAGGNNGTFAIEAPNAATATYRFNARATAATGLIASTYEAPLTNVISCVIDLSGGSTAAEIFPRIDGEIPTTSAAGGASAGSGNFGNHVINMLGRGSAILPFVGRVYGLMIRGADSTDAEIELGESLMAAACGRDLVGPFVMVKVDQANDVISVYRPANTTPGTDKYIHTRLLHYTAADADVWTVSGIWEATRTGYESFTDTLRLQVESTEILCAIQEDGKADFMGGSAHGDEVKTAAATLTVDGVSIPTDSGALKWVRGKSVVFAQTSKLYEVGSALAVERAQREMTLTFDPYGYTLAQTVSHLANYTIGAAYFAMIAPHRYETYVGGVSEDDASTQISGQFRNNVDNVWVDASAYTLDDADSYRNGTPRVTGFDMTGENGNTFSVEVVSCSPDIVKDVFYMNRASYAYNKGYIGIIKSKSGAQAVTPSTVWQMTTRVEITGN
jgi:hypothetical protein